MAAYKSLVLLGILLSSAGNSLLIPLPLYDRYARAFHQLHGTSAVFATAAGGDDLRGEEYYADAMASIVSGDEASAHPLDDHVDYQLCQNVSDGVTPDCKTWCHDKMGFQTGHLMPPSYDECCCFNN
ncbi:hypothetical protein ACP4OV_002244 [Aristida adscensionis]